MTGYLLVGLAGAGLGYLAQERYRIATNHWVAAGVGAAGAVIGAAAFSALLKLVSIVLGAIIGVAVLLFALHYFGKR